MIKTIKDQLEKSKEDIELAGETIYKSIEVSFDLAKVCAKELYKYGEKEHLEYVEEVEKRDIKDEQASDAIFSSDL